MSQTAAAGDPSGAALAAGPPRDRSGAILAARWSIERRHRPAGSGLIWLGYAKPEIVSDTCLACGEAGFKQGVVRIDGRTLYLCGACASHQVHPIAAPPQPSGFVRRYQREYLPDLAAAAALAARAVAGRRPGRLLDLADDLALTADLVGCHPGWEAGGLAAGAAACGCEVVVSAGDLQRSADPLGLLREAAAAATADARWLLATGDAAMLYAADDAASVRRLLPADLLLLPSRIGLQRLLLRAGLPELAVRSTGATLLAERDAPAADADDAAKAMLDAYLAASLTAPPDDPSLRLGLLARTLQRAVERADWLLARRIAASLAPALAASVDAARAGGAKESLEQLLAAAPVCGAALLYASGMLHLQGDGPSTQALLCFELCAELARRAHALAPEPMQPEAERHFAARFQAGVVRRRMGEAEAARAVFQALVDAADPVAAPWATRARAELAAVAAAPVPAGKSRRAARAVP